VNIAVVFHRFGPYHCARLRAAAKGCQITAIELSAKTREYGWDTIPGSNDYERLTLFENGDSRDASSGEVEKRVTDILAAVKPDAVAVPGWSERGALAAVLWCYRTNTPAILMSESSAHDEPRTLSKEFLKSRLLRCYSAALVGGSMHKSYLESLGFPGDRIFFGYDVVDNDYFARSAKEVRDRKSEVRGQYRLPENYFLASARFIEKKNLFTLLRAYARYREMSDVRGQRSEVSSQKSEGGSDRRSPTSDIWSLVLLGDGPLRDAINRELITLNLQNHVLLPGFKQYADLPAYYAFARAFIHASATEQWGLVVNEAIATGLPVIVSNRCGCVPELVRENFNGFTFDPHDTDSLAQLLSRVGSLLAEEWERLSSGSRYIASQNEPERFAQGLRSAVQTALELPRTRSSLLERILLKSWLYR
jgi:1,2-diacylglycerol 3-alpha-glucosyltransferase